MSPKAMIGTITSARGRPLWRRLRRGDWMIVALLVLYVACVLLPPFIAPHDPNQVALTVPLASPSAEYPLGSDEIGRDIFSRMIAAAQIAMLAGVGSVTIALVAGSVLGVVAGYMGGYVDLVINRFADLLFAFPGFLIAIILVAGLGPGVWEASLAIGIIFIPRFIRITRVEAMRVMGSSYVDAARLARRSGPYIMARHVLPNISSPLVVLTALSMSTAQATYASLSFLGYGARAPQADYGQMLMVGRVYMLQDPGYVIAPAIVLTGLILSFNLLGDTLRDRLDPRAGKHGI